MGVSNLMCHLHNIAELSYLINLHKHSTIYEWLFYYFPNKSKQVPIGYKSNSEFSINIAKTTSHPIFLNMTSKFY